MRRRLSRLRILLKVLLSGLVLSGAALAAWPVSSPAQGYAALEDGTGYPTNTKETTP